MKLESWATPESKRVWKVVRLDTHADVPGEIIAADDASGECTMFAQGETKTHNFGVLGIKLVGRGR
jgi:hypothetical protein